jgi:hypothetical protein
MKQFVMVFFMGCSLMQFLAGCSSVSVQTKQYLGVPQYSPTDPANVAILREPPVRPHIRLGEVTLEPQDSPPVAVLEQKLQQAAAQMGADAAVIVADRTMRMGAIVTGPWWGREISPEFGRVIVAVAIKYTQ